MAYVPIHDDVRLAFYVHYMRSDRFRKRLNAVATGTTNSHVRVRPPETLRWIVPFPGPGEQLAIARILDAMDAAINRTRDAITKATEARCALLQQLLSRGIGANGKLRSKDKIHRAFRKTDEVVIPRDWNLSTVREEFHVQTGFTLNEERRPRSNARQYLRVANVQRDDIDLTDIAQLEATDIEMRSRTLQLDDLLIVEGHADSRQIGRCARVPNEAVGMTFQNHLYRLRARKISAAFVCLWLNSEYARRYWHARCATSSGLNTINQRQLKRLDIPVPDPREQIAIPNVIQSQRRHIESLEDVLHRQGKVKRGFDARPPNRQGSR